MEIKSCKECGHNHLIRMNFRSERINGKTMPVSFDRCEKCRHDQNKVFVHESLEQAEGRKGVLSAGIKKDLEQISLFDKVVGGFR